MGYCKRISKFLQTFWFGMARRCTNEGTYDFELFVGHAGEAEGTYDFELSVGHGGEAEGTVGVGRNEADDFLESVTELEPGKVALVAVYHFLYGESNS